MRGVLASGQAGPRMERLSMWYIMCGGFFSSEGLPRMLRAARLQTVLCNKSPCLNTNLFFFCVCSLLNKPTAPLEERHTPHGGSDKSTTRNFGDHLYTVVLAQESILYDRQTDSLSVCLSVTLRVVTTAGRGTNRGTRPQTRLRGGVPSCVLLRPSSGKCGGEEEDRGGKT